MYMRMIDQNQTYWSKKSPFSSLFSLSSTFTIFFRSSSEQYFYFILFHGRKRNSFLSHLRQSRVHTIHFDEMIWFVSVCPQYDIKRWDVWLETFPMCLPWTCVVCRTVSWWLGGCVCVERNGHRQRFSIFTSIWHDMLFTMINTDLLPRVWGRRGRCSFFICGCQWLWVWETHQHMCVYMKKTKEEKKHARMRCLEKWINAFGVYNFNYTTTTTNIRVMCMAMVMMKNKKNLSGWEKIRTRRACVVCRRSVYYTVEEKKIRWWFILCFDIQLIKYFDLCLLSFIFLYVGYVWRVHGLSLMFISRI